MPKVISQKNLKEKHIKSYWPNSAKRFFASLSEIPWIGLTAVSTLAGVSILFAYFRSIDHFPSDFSAVIVLGAAAAACGLGFLVLISLSLFGPAFIYHNSPLPLQELNSTQENDSRQIELVCLQLGGFGALCLSIAYPELRDCGGVMNAWAISGFGLILFALFALIKVVRKGKNWHDRLLNSLYCFLISFMALVPLIFLALLLDQLKFTSVNSFILLLSCWLIVIIANSAAATKLRGYVVLALAFIVATYSVVFLPLITSSPSLFPKVVAGYLGVIDIDPQVLKIPTKTCTLIAGSASANSKVKDLVCLSGDWGQVKAQVLSNVGERWLLEIATENLQTKQVSKLRLTVPSAEIQTIKLVELTRGDEKPTVCKKP
jgi:hypothetical protein